jgi:hypothetical protein
VANKRNVDAGLDPTMTAHHSRLRARLSDETGMSLIEAVVACGILIVVIAGVIGAQAMATSMTENNGHLGARTAEYAVDKMEQLLELTYGDAQSNTTVFPSINNGGTGLAVGGSSNPDAPVVATPTISTPPATSCARWPRPVPRRRRPTGTTSGSGRCRSRRPTSN